MDFIKKYKLRILSILSVLFLFLPFVKQCDVNEVKSSDFEFNNSNAENMNFEYSFDLKKYFTEESESVFDLSNQLNKFFETNILNDLGAIILISSSLFSILLFLFSLLGLYKIFKNMVRNISKVYLTNLILVVLILAINAYFFIDRIGQVKIGFYLLLITNFYLFRHFRKLKIDK